MELNKQCEITASKNTIILNNIINYMCYLFNINKLDIITDKVKTKYYIKQLLLEVFNNNKECVILREERKNKMDDLKYLEASTVRGCSYESDGSDKDNGGHGNNVELKLYKIEELRDEIDNLVNESLLLEKTLYCNNDLIRSFIRLLPQRQYIAIMESAYFSCQSTTDISINLGYSYEYTKKVRMRAIDVLATILSYVK